jgi:hypothetical protein
MQRAYLERPQVPRPKASDKCHAGVEGSRRSSSAWHAFVRTFTRTSRRRRRTKKSRSFSVSDDSWKIYFGLVEPLPLATRSAENGTAGNGTERGFGMRGVANTALLDGEHLPVGTSPARPDVTSGTVCQKRHHQDWPSCSGTRGVAIHGRSDAPLTRVFTGTTLAYTASGARTHCLGRSPRGRVLATGSVCSGDSN